MKGFVTIEPTVLMRRAVLLAVFVLVSCFKQPDAAPPAQTSAPTGDTTGPTAPANFTAVATGLAQIALTWSAATDNVGVAMYFIERCQGPGCSSFSQVATTPNVAWSDSGLTPSTPYSYRVRATDSVGNLGQYSQVASDTTFTPPPDTTPPTAPTNLTATAAGAQQINLSWTASTDDVGVTLYFVDRCQGSGCTNFSEIGTTPNTAWNDSGLTPSTPYSYRVRARDLANNVGAFSPVASDTTFTISVSLTPRQGGLTLGQSLAITATVTNDFGPGGVTWSVSGSGAGFSSTTRTSATFSSATAGSYTITATSLADPSRKGFATIGVTDLGGIFTNRYNSQRTGQNQQERALTLASVNSSSFGRLFGCAVDDAIYAQPLYMANLQIAGGTHNVVFVGTMSNTVYAFDGDDPSCIKYWQRSLLQGNETPVPVADTDPAAPTRNDIQGVNIGIMGTPVIDPATKTLYVVSKTKETNTLYHQRLHALNLLDGTNAQTPAELNDSIVVAGNADTGDAGSNPTTTCSASAGNVPFCSLHQSQRPGLLLSNGRVYVAWAGHDDIEPFHGWVMGFSANNISAGPAVVFNTTPNSQTYQQSFDPPPAKPHAMGGIWQGGTGPAADAAGEIYFGTGNGATDTVDPRSNWSDSFLRLTPGLTTLSVSTLCGINKDIPCYFTPINEQTYQVNDTDLDSGGPMLLPDSAGNPGGAFGLRRHLMIGGDKKSILYLMDRDDMGLYNNAVGGGDDTLQQVTLAGMKRSDGTAVGCGATQFCGVFSTPSFWQGNIYVIAVNDVLKRFPIANAVIDISPANVGFGPDIFKFPGAQTAISSNGGADGIVWALNTSNNGTRNTTPLDATVLFAYDAVTLQKLYSSPATAGAGAAGNAVKFQVPTVANGKVYIGTHDELSVFGLLP